MNLIEVREGSCPNGHKACIEVVSMPMEERSVPIVITRTECRDPDCTVGLRNVPGLEAGRGQDANQ
jgi:hypothetical protein